MLVLLGLGARDPGKTRGCLVQTYIFLANGPPISLLVHRPHRCSAGLPHQLMQNLPQAVANTRSTHTLETLRLPFTANG